MRKALSAAALLLVTFTITANSKRADASAADFHSPVIVVKARLLNQTAPIPNTTIYTPTQDGIYRVSVYMTLTGSVAQSGSQWGCNLAWFDDAGAEAANGIVILLGNQLSPNAYGTNEYGNLGGGRAIEAKSGSPITYGVAQYGPPDGSTYSLYFTVEKLD